MFDENLEIGTREAPSRRVLLAASSLKPVFFDPISDRCFVPSEATAECPQRLALPQKLL
jgi:hypothetical protein